MTKKHEYNLTYLDPKRTFERGVFHRDQFAHFLRWSHVLKMTGYNRETVLDYGSGTGRLMEVLYRNRRSPKKYIGLEYSSRQVKSCKEEYDNVDWAEFKQCDIIKDVEKMEELGTFDIVASFEVVEHVNKKNADTFFKNMKLFCHEDTVCLVSTPIYDEGVGAAKNHIIDGVVQEFGFNELKEIIERNGFEIVDTFGTFASQKDYKPHMNKWQSEMFKELKKYYPADLVSNLMAPFFPEQSRNCLWKLRLKNEE